MSVRRLTATAVVLAAFVLTACTSVSGGAGTFPPCSDTNHSHESALAARVGRIDGVDPAVAVAVYPDGRVFVLPPAVVPRGLTDAPWLRGKASS